jgi:hypothetical protein
MIQSRQGRLRITQDAILGYVRLALTKTLQPRR